MTDQQILAGFHAALDNWFAAHDAAVADLTARHERHKADLAAAAALQSEWEGSDRD